MKRARSQARKEADFQLLAQIKALKQDHPFWGYRRIWAYLRYRQGICLGKNRVYRVMKEHHLLVKQNLKLRARRYSTRPKPRAKVPNQYWGMDMTKVKLNSWGWIYIHCVLDWATKEVIGYHVSLTSNTYDWLEALHSAVSNRFPEGIDRQKGKPKLITDNGCQPSSEAFMKDCSTLGIKQIFTTWNNPKGNADTERFFRTLKEDLVWTHEWDLPFQFQADFDAWIHAYNSDFPHQSLAYKTPAQAMLAFLDLKFKKEVASSKKHSLVFA